MKYLEYLSYIIRHKWYVFLECYKNHRVWLGIIHDWSKFLPSEFFPYANHFYGKGKAGIGEGRDKTGYYKPSQTGDDAFDFAWILHAKRNKHHWQWWVIPQERGEIMRLSMPAKYLAEMIADWKGASRAQGHGGHIAEWYSKNREKLFLHPHTKERVDFLVCADHSH